MSVIEQDFVYDHGQWRPRIVKTDAQPEVEVIQEDKPIELILTVRVIVNDGTANVNDASVQVVQELKDGN